MDLTPEDVTRTPPRPRWYMRAWRSARRGVLCLLPITLLLLVTVLNALTSGQSVLAVVTGAVWLVLAFALGAYAMATAAATAAPKHRKGTPHGPDCGCNPEEMMALVGCQCGWRETVRADQANAAGLHHAEFECPLTAKGGGS